VRGATLQHADYPSLSKRSQYANNCGLRRNRNPDLRPIIACSVAVAKVGVVNRPLHSKLPLPRSMSDMAIFRQLTFGITPNPTAFIDLPVSQT
jgi:hypothetical protein